MILKASAANGSVMSGCRSMTVVSSPTAWPLIAGTSTGLGRKSTIASSIGCTPLFLNALPHITGVTALAMVARRIAATSCSSLGSLPSRYSSIISSSFSAMVSISLSRQSRAASAWSSGMDTMSYVSPLPSVCQTRARILIRSMTPRKSDSTPHGSWMTSGVAPRRSVIMSTQRWNSAPTRSILLTKQILGTPYRSAWRHTVSDCGSTPATPSKTATAPSSTRSDRSTSTVKSTWPGVSMMLMVWSRHMVVVAAEVMVIPRSCSCSIQSIVAAPSWTSPIL